MRNATLVALATWLLAGCTGGPARTAVDACVQAITERMSGRNHSIDPRRMLADVVTEDDGQLLVRSPIVFDRGLPNEYTQTFDCRVRVTDGQGAVTFLQFQW